ncbi:molybdopterin-guanine dinucleotide biosynthesis protein MobB [Duffyella gerundensis]|uniref:molybdopterin-guanine dinucleotide biosynthesis protein MobB n=1 Tax=Duffyella gerundensis TaxID=1619313 RepID=UPI0021F6BD37|nr:molybdopterin-guanine dinucleotide biosynthesis protein MobB [Duffyella gerundensis]
MLPLLAVVAWSGTGKTTLLTKLIPCLKAKGIRPGLIKHTHHEMDVDTPGKDSYRLRKAGADQVIVASSQRWALMTETPAAIKLELRDLAAQFDENITDLILVEGFKGEDVPKIVLWREGVKGELSDLLDKKVIAVASDVAIEVNMPRLNLNNVDEIAQFIVEWLAECSNK